MQILLDIFFMLFILVSGFIIMGFTMGFITIERRKEES